MQHGYTSDKSNGAHFMAYPLAKLGYKVVSIDAYKHGSRIEEPYISGPEIEKRKEFFFLIDKTARDIDYLYETYYKEEFPTFDMIGVSMGGMIAYRLSMISRAINKLFPVITLPTFTEFAKQTITELFPGTTEALEHLEQIAAFDPGIHYHLFHYNEMHIFNAKDDTILPLHYTESFLEKLPNKHITFKTFPGGHETTQSIQPNIID